MKRAYERRQILAREGELIEPEVAPAPLSECPTTHTDEAGAPSAPAARPGRPSGLPWETLPLSGSVCRRCRAPVKLTWEGTRARRECPNGCFVATANYRNRTWEIEEPRAEQANE